MLIRLMQGLGIFYYWTWFIWPFIFVYSFTYGLASIIKDEKISNGSIVTAGISLLIILSGITAQILIYKF